MTRRGVRSRRDALETLSIGIEDSDVCTRVLVVLEEHPANGNHPPTEELPPVRFSR